MVTFSALPSAEEGPDSQQKFKGVSRILGPKWAHMPIITIGLLGVQIFWSVEMSYASPYLLSLGLSKSNMAIVFIAGPISGLLVQPLIGVLADSSTSRFGRRRPYMLAGTVICVLAMLLLGFTRSVASIFTGWDNSANDTLTIWLAVLSIYLIDFSINAVQAVDRALLVDTAPPSEQASGNAWAARMLGVGSVVGFFVGNIDLPRIVPFFGDSQLKVLSVVVSILLLGGHILMCVLVKERVLLKDSNGKTNRKSFSQEIKDIWVNMRTLPHTIQQICFIQLFAWIAWFPILFYSTIYVGDFHKRNSPLPDSPQEQDILDTEATRLGSRALFYSALISLFLNLVLPAFVTETAGKASPRASSPQWGLVIPPRLKVHLSTMWAIGHLILSACMFATFFVDSVWGATTIITITGFSWAVTQWAPFALLAEAILTEPVISPDASDNIRMTDARTGSRSSDDNEREIFLAGNLSDDDEDEERTEDQRRMMGNSGAQVSRIRIREAEDEDYQLVSNGNGRGRSERRGAEAGTLSSKAGIILGIHNIFIVIPQFLVTGLSAVLFALLDGDKSSLPNHRAPVAPAPINGTLLSLNGTEELASRVGEVLFDTRAEFGDDVQHSNSVVYIFRIGGVAAAFAFVLCWRLSRRLQHKY
ncbi:major facilitator superfamily domain-containing protein [Panaeolus papilionaceus]|nr:major facilitator superfamily domain-containing protein [Panaeolus papilionaceus]